MFELYYILIFLLGLAIGSFINAWEWRTREKMALFFDRSVCPNCRMMIAWYDNIPLIGFARLKGFCRSCQGKISWQYPLVELWCGLSFVGVAYWHNYFFGTLWLSPTLIRDWLILVFLTFIFLYDFKYREILDFSTLVSGVILFIFSFIFGWQSGISMIFGAATGAGFFLIMYFGSRGRWIGGGDARLGFFMGIILGWPLILLGLMLSYIIGAVFSLALIALKKKTMKSETAFGTYLVAGTIVTMFWGEKILDWYLSFI